MGGESFSSRHKCATMAVMLPPADVPPIMKPLLGSAPSLEAFAAA